MEVSEKNYTSFLVALDHWVKITGWGAQTTLAAATQMSLAYIGQILARNKVASFASQVKLAEACGYSYPDFLIFGRKLLDGENPAPPPEQNTEAQKIMEKLSNINKDGQKAFETLLDGYMAGMEKGNRKIQSRMRRSIAQLTLDDYKVIGNELKRCNESLVHATVLIRNGNPKKSEEYMLTGKLQKMLDRLRSIMEDQMYQRYPDTTELQIFYGPPKDLLKES